MLDHLRARVLGSGTNPGLRLLFDGLVVLTGLSRGRTERHAAEMRGLSGAIEYELTGPGGGHWHAVVSPGSVRFHRGGHPAPLATVSMGVSDFFRLLTGHGSFMTAQMSGRVRVRGDGHATMIVGAMLAELRNGRKRPGAEGRFRRAWIDAAVRLSGTELEFAEPARETR